MEGINMSKTEDGSTKVTPQTSKKEEELLISLEKIKIWNQKIEDLKKSGKRAAVFGHDRGDPDSFACMMALKFYFHSLGIEADIFSGGKSGHPMNSEMVKDLKIEIKNNMAEGGRGKYGLMIMCDAMPCRSTVLKDFNPDIVIDHHENPSVFDKNVLFIHSRIGACSTIIYFLLKHLKIELSETVATALALGISADTKDFSKTIEIEEWDKQAHKELRGIYDYGLFEKIHKWYTLTDAHLGMIAEAYSSRRYLDNSNDVMVMGLVDVSEGQTDYLSHIVDTAMRTSTKIGIIIAIESGKSIQVKVRENSNLMIEVFCKEVFEINEYESDKNKASAGGRIGSGGANIPFTPRERGVWETIEKESDHELKRKKKEDFFNFYFEYYIRKIEKYIQNNGI